MLLALFYYPADRILPHPMHQPIKHCTPPQNRRVVVINIVQSSLMYSIRRVDVIVRQIGRQTHRQNVERSSQNNDSLRSVKHTHPSGGLGN